MAALVFVVHNKNVWHICQNLLIISHFARVETHREREKKYFPLGKSDPVAVDC